MSIQELENICHTNHKKVSNGERLLRIMRAEFFEGEKNPYYISQVGVTMKGNAIIGYTYTMTEEQKFYKQPVLIDPRTNKPININ